MHFSKYIPITKWHLTAEANEIDILNLIKTENTHTLRHILKKHLCITQIQAEKHSTKELVKN